MSVSLSDPLVELTGRMEALMEQVDSALASAEPEDLFTLARHQADLLTQLKGCTVTEESAAALSRALEKSRHLARRIEDEMDEIRSRLTASANKKRIRGAYAAPH